MRWARWFTPLWPGLTQLWFSGAWWGLAVGCGFAWLFNLAVVSTFVWTEWIDPWQRLGVWVLLGLIWTISVTLSFRQLLGYDPDRTAKTAEDLFRQAQREYLTGNWIKAEQFLTQLTNINKKDVDAQLLLTSLLRRTGHLSEAADRLRRLGTIHGAEKWHSEIERERQLINDQFNQLQTSSADDQNETNQAGTNPPVNKAA